MSLLAYEVPSVTTFEGSSMIVVRVLGGGIKVHG